MTVIAGVDASPVSQRVVASALEQARWQKTDLHVVHVMQLPVGYAEVAVDWNEIAKAQRESIWGALGEVMDVPDVNVQKVDLDGYPPDTLVAYADEANASLIVIGTRGRGDFASLVLGSTSHRALHLAKCDVLVVKAPSE
jgi:nucleotide-binding universal stress UspA family protein